LLAATRGDEVMDTVDSERRRTPRFPFVASAEIVEISSGVRLDTRVSELSLYGCYLDMIVPIARGTLVLVRIFTETDFFEARANVVYSQTNLGVGLAFRDVRPQFLPVLEKWLQSAVRETFRAER
jgi:hypothetical protein